ncbi:MotE family protein [Amphibacillus sediminis]|uniref:MotE family protein n=1 Tax=Amphibacillus sediminis TaxID=360185 RepID=UPI0012EDE348|nr:hypothetical protein [Amphibacillus sediminis]
MAQAQLQENEYNEPKKRNVLKWLLLIIVPLALAITILVAVLSMLGMDPIGQAKEIANSIPGLNLLITTDQEAEFERKERQYLSQIENHQQNIEALEVELSNKSTELDQLNQEIVRLTQQLDNFKDNDQEGQQQLANDSLNKLAKTYQEMAPANAASILSSTDQQVALTILQEIKDAQRAAILSEMEPETAAKFTEQLLD